MNYLEALTNVKSALPADCWQEIAQYVSLTQRIIPVSLVNRSAYEGCMHIQQEKDDTQDILEWILQMNFYCRFIFPGSISLFQENIWILTLISEEHALLISWLYPEILQFVRVDTADLRLRFLKRVSMRAYNRKNNKKYYPKD